MVVLRAFGKFLHGKVLSYKHNLREHIKVTYEKNPCKTNGSIIRLSVTRDWLKHLPSYSNITAKCIKLRISNPTTLMQNIFCFLFGFTPHISLN